MTEDSNVVLISFAVNALDPMTFHVQQLTGTEGVNQLFHFELTLTAAGEVPLHQVTGQRATLSMGRAPGAVGDPELVRRVHGMVDRFERVRRDASTGAVSYRARLVPQEARLHHRTNCRIFQDQHMEQVVAAVLKGHRRKQHHLFTHDSKPAPRDYCVQYLESDWDFIQRLLEEEGYLWFHQHEQQGVTLLMSNRAGFGLPLMPATLAEQQAAGSQPPRPILFSPLSGQQPATEFIFELSFASQLCPGRAHGDDYFFQLQNSDLMSTDAALPLPKDGITADQSLELYSYPSLPWPAEQTHLGQADELLQRAVSQRLEQARSEALQGSGQSTCVRLAPGHYFTLEQAPGAQHLDAALCGQQYLVLELVHEASTSSPPPVAGGATTSECRYHNRFRCVPLALPHRPARRACKPVIRGVQTAVVVGPKNEQVYTDKFGRVKVRFRWDREARLRRDQQQSLEQSSCWIRVSQPWAGAGWGALWLPRVDSEVLVSFEDGDPDRPIITGQVYNAINLPPEDLPRHKTRSTFKSRSVPGGRGSNELRFEDKRGGEQLYLHAQRDLDQVVGRNHTRAVRQDETVEVQQGDRKVNVRQGRLDSYVEQDSAEVVKGTRSVSVTEGDATINVMNGQHQLTVHKDLIIQVAQGDRRTTVVKGNQQTTLDAGDLTTTLTRGDKRTEVVKGHLRTILCQGNALTQLDKGSLQLLAEEGSIVLKAKGGSITIDDSGIKIEAAAGKPVTITGKTVDLN